MARQPKRRKRKDGGPYLSAAVFCDNVLKGDDGAMTVVRIVDRLNITLPAGTPPDIPSDENRVLAQIWAFVAFKKGDAEGVHEVRLMMHSPSGKKAETGRQQMKFAGDAYSGGNLRINCNIAVHEGGLFWMDVILDGKLMTRMPLQISVKRTEPVVASAPSSAPRKERRKAK